MTELPVGTVTFLFTDIEGSTRLLVDAGSSYDSLLETHDRVLRDAIAGHDGLIVNTEGDAFFAVFPLAPDALKAVVEIQQSLNREEWPLGLAVRVRMGLHSGEGRRGAADYVGIDVHRAARVASLGHGGQILLSQTTRSLVEGVVPDEWVFRDLGHYKLKGIPDPERIYQLEAPGIPSAFPPLRSRTDAADHLPKRASTFVGREPELETLDRLLGRTRLLTFTGPGGSGKTMLALELARRHASDHADGAWFVDLEDVREPGAVRSEIAHGLGLFDGAVGPAADRLHDFVAERDLLILIDNFEQVIEAAREVAELLSASEQSRIIVTSRIPLHLSAEQEYAVGPLGMDSPDRGSMSDAVSLFIDRAHRVRPDLRIDGPDLEVVLEICRLLDGLPLAIELAAARVSALPLALIRDRLVAHLPLPGAGPRDVPARQRTIEATVDWSRDLLDVPLQRLFDRLGIFEGSVDLDQAQRVCGSVAESGIEVLDGLYDLVERSLVMPLDDHIGGTRFRIPETIRARALAHLTASGEEASLRKRHTRVYADLAAEAGSGIPGPEQARWLDRLAADEANLRTAVRSAINSNDADTALRLLGDIWRCWLAIGRLAEARELVRVALSMPGADVPSQARLKALEAAGGIAYWSGDVVQTASFYEERLSLAERLGDAQAEGQGWLDLYFTRLYSGDTEGANVAIEAAGRRFEDAGDGSGAARVEGASNTSLLLAAVRDLPSVRSKLEEAVRRYESSADLSLRRIGHVLQAVPRLLEGDGAGALKPAVAAMRHDLAVRDTAEAILDLQSIAVALRLAGRHEAAAVMQAAGEAAVERYGVRPVFAELLEQTVFAARGPVPVETLSDERHGAAIDRGRGMSLADAAEFIEDLVGTS